MDPTFIKQLEQHAPKVCMGLASALTASQELPVQADFLLEICKIAEWKLTNRRVPVEQIRQCPLKFGFQWLESACLEEEKTLQDLWANLLTNALSPDFENDLLSVYISIIRDLSPTDVATLKMFYMVTTKTEQEKLLSLVKDKKAHRMSREELRKAVSFENIKRLRLIDSVSTAIVPVAPDGVLGVNLFTHRAKFPTCNALTQADTYLTALGFAFYKACVIDASNAPEKSNKRKPIESLLGKGPVIQL